MFPAGIIAVTKFSRTLKFLASSASDIWIMFCANVAFKSILRVESINSLAISRRSPDVACPIILWASAAAQKYWPTGARLLNPMSLTVPSDCVTRKEHGVLFCLLLACATEALDPNVPWIPPPCAKASPAINTPVPAIIWPIAISLSAPPFLNARIWCGVTTPKGPFLIGAFAMFTSTLRKGIKYLPQ